MRRPCICADKSFPLDGYLVLELHVGRRERFGDLVVVLSEWGVIARGLFRCCDFMWAATHQRSRAVVVSFAKNASAYMIFHLTLEPSGLSFCTSLTLVALRIISRYGQQRNSEKIYG